MDKQNCKINCNIKGNSSFYSLIALLVVGVIAVTAYSSLASDEAEEVAHSSTTTMMEDSSKPQMAALGLQEYSKSAYEKALSDGKTVLLDFHADWCPTCVENAPKLESALSQLNDSSIIAFKANYDTESELKRQFGIYSQASFILLKEGKVVQKAFGPLSVEQFKDLLMS